MVRLPKDLSLVASGVVWFIIGVVVISFSVVQLFS